MAVGVDVRNFIYVLGHDGSEKINQLPDPLCRRGHHVQECVLAAMALGYSATPFELFPQAASPVPGNPPRVVHYHGLDEQHNWTIFANIVRNSRGVLCGVGRGSHHAVAFDHGQILDPDGRTYPYSRAACEHRFFYTQVAWRVAALREEDYIVYADGPKDGSQDGVAT